MNPPCFGGKHLKLLWFLPTGWAVTFKMSILYCFLLLEIGVFLGIEMCTVYVYNDVALLTKSHAGLLSQIFINFQMLKLFDPQSLIPQHS